MLISLIIVSWKFSPSCKSLLHPLLLSGDQVSSPCLFSRWLQIWLSVTLEFWVHPQELRKDLVPSASFTLKRSQTFTIHFKEKKQLSCQMENCEIMRLPNSKPRKRYKNKLKPMMRLLKMQTSKGGGFLLAVDGSTATGFSPSSGRLTLGWAGWGWLGVLLDACKWFLSERLACCVALAPAFSTDFSFFSFFSPISRIEWGPDIDETASSCTAGELVLIPQKELRLGYFFSIFQNIRCMCYDDSNVK